MIFFDGNNTYRTSFEAWFMLQRYREFAIERFIHYMFNSWKLHISFVSMFSKFDFIQIKLRMVVNCWNTADRQKKR